MFSRVLNTPMQYMESKKPFMRDHILRKKHWYGITQVIKNAGTTGFFAFDTFFELVLHAEFEMKSV